jgi:CheY-like chemotaxis protein
VVDNEETDRELLTALLEPLGFELRTAASGHDALDLIVSGYAPDAILMDLAMPGIDGWETIRRIRTLENVGNVHFAVVSANAFDKGLENNVGISPEDFILKPLRHTELLDWLEKRLAMVWIEPGQQQMLSKMEQRIDIYQALPVDFDRKNLDPLRQAVALGYYRGILNQLDAIENRYPCAASCVVRWRELARQFRFEDMAQELHLSPPEPAHE